MWWMTERAQSLPAASSRDTPWHSTITWRRCPRPLRAAPPALASPLVSGTGNTFSVAFSSVGWLHSSALAAAAAVGVVRRRRCEAHGVREEEEEEGEEEKEELE